MKLIGLTGGIACGKSTLLKIFQDLGAEVLSADDVVHGLLKKEGKAFEAVLSCFGQKILNSSSEIDRVKLGEVVFSNPDQRELLENILHPLVKSDFLQWKASNKNKNILVYEIPLLFEKNRQADFDETICVSCSEDLQISRLMNRNNLSESEARSRLSSQMPLKKKIKMADLNIVNEEKEILDLVAEVKSKYF